MIQQDQPANFPTDLQVAVSSREDGTMLDRSQVNRHDIEIVQNRQLFCQNAGMDYQLSVYQIISYGEDRTYDNIVEVTSPDTHGVSADVLYTEQPGVGLFLPIADCVATVIYDPIRKALALAHLGRHATVAGTMAKTIAFFVARGSDPQDLHIWMAPSVKQPSYRMEYFNAANNPDWQRYCDHRSEGFYLDLPGYNRAVAVGQGVDLERIDVSPVDTATSTDYFSHSKGDQTGRFAVVAMIRS